ncbi:G-type lectin S-receptor-like serine/threonine-protein kinase At4g27290 isoform X2 [Malus sylvestris]|uniref:G-type lectin S-receptor-like serine/threonine-protein kinase At4g27290 isoform X2 n=1 Tax=Malus sylvestris TaxID=3752 RepID=UPI0021ABCB7D|nr:G-type lectin S-receptor-like serine/threonine-protein kinase At4g27290 isoform X2 [Malus sylvestris]
MVPGRWFCEIDCAYHLRYQEGGSGCFLWLGNLTDVKEFTPGGGGSFGMRCQKKGLRKRVPWRSRENMELPLFDLTTVAKPLATSQAATSWEKVALDLCTRRDDIVVKRLSKNSGQEMREFKNDNLVKLLGCCIWQRVKLFVVVDPSKASWFLH